MIIGLRVGYRFKVYESRFKIIIDESQHRVLAAQVTSGPWPVIRQGLSKMVRVTPCSQWRLRIWRFNTDLSLVLWDITMADNRISWFSPLTMVRSLQTVEIHIHVVVVGYYPLVASAEVTRRNSYSTCTQYLTTISYPSKIPWFHLASTAHVWNVAFSPSRQAQKLAWILEGWSNDAATKSENGRTAGGLKQGPQQWLYCIEFRFNLLVKHGETWWHFPRNIVSWIRLIRLVKPIYCWRTFFNKLHWDCMILPPYS